MSLELIAAVASAVSALAALTTAVILFFQTKMAREQNTDQIKRLAAAQERENSIAEAKNKILINKMINDFNKIIIDSDEDLRGQVGARTFKSDASLVKRIYLQFIRLNIIDSALMLRSSGGMPDDAADEFINTLSKNLNSDPEATRIALGRGYRKEFIDEVSRRASLGEVSSRSDVGLSEKEATVS